VECWLFERSNKNEVEYGVDGWRGVKAGVYLIMIASGQEVEGK
jgi:hypothetical protein